MRFLYKKRTCIIFGFTGYKEKELKKKKKNCQTTKSSLTFMEYSAYSNPIFHPMEYCSVQ